MSLHFLNLMAPLFGLCCNIIAQILLVRLVRIKLMKSVFYGFFLGVFIMLAIEMLYCLLYKDLNLIDFIFVLLTNVIIYGALGYCYFHFINLGVTGRRIRILCELHKAEKGLTLIEILQRYNARELIDNRLTRLINNRQIIMRGDKYIVKQSPILLVTLLILKAKRLIIGKESEFD